jgi:hypothetical protein
MKSNEKRHQRSNRSLCRNLQAKHRSINIRTASRTLGKTKKQYIDYILPRFWWFLYSIILGYALAYATIAQFT